MDFFSDRKSSASNDDRSQSVSTRPWKVLLIDDDRQMHDVTRLALTGFEFRGRKLDIASVYSAEEAQIWLKNNTDTALALIDVVMETEHAGLDLVRFIRDDLQNSMIRLVLRTGQAGQAPEDIVIREYEIDDYKEKTELTLQKLKTLLYSGLRSYNDLCVIERQKMGLKKVIQASAQVQNTSTMKAYAATVLEQLTSLLGIEGSALYCLFHPKPEGEECRALTLAATGEYIDCHSGCDFSDLPPLVSERCQIVLQSQQSQHFDDAYVLYANDEHDMNCLLYVNVNKKLSEHDCQLLEIYMRNIGLTFENLNLLEDLRETSKELVYNLANAVEARSKETGSHVQRVSIICEKLAKFVGLTESKVVLIKHASPLHDVGKVAIPDHILHKPGKLTDDEWETMQKHVEFGVEILNKSNRKLMKLAAVIAATHHEKWDGTGYPNQLKGEEIPIEGRIAALADVFDALGSARSYKKPWSEQAIYDEIQSQSGKHFDPKLVTLLLDHWQDFIQIREQYPD